MATLNQQLTRAKALAPEKISRELFNFVRSIEKQVTAKNVEQIFEFSTDIFGKPLGFYSEETEAINPEKKAGTPFTGRNTGSWLDGFRISVVGEIIVFTSTDAEKTQLIKGPKSTWLSKELFGLTDENLRELIQNEMLPFLLTHIKKNLAVQ